MISCGVPFLTVLLYRYVHRAILVSIVGGRGCLAYCSTGPKRTLLILSNLISFKFYSVCSYHTNVIEGKKPTH